MHMKNLEEKVYPISELFASPQGEGLYAGTAMLFVRLAGCSVGKRFPKERYEGPNALPIYTEMCTLWDGRTFECDTDYRVKHKLTAKEIYAQLPKGVMHVCITGGEPLIHELDALYTLAPNDDIMFHIETSGTVSLTKAFKSTPCYLNDRIWVTVAPKYPLIPDMIQRANEIKLLVDEDFDPGKLPLAVLQHPLVFIMAVNYEHSVNRENIKRVMEWHKKFPAWRIGLQLHKVLQEYSGERVL